MGRRLPAYRPGVRMLSLSGRTLHWAGFLLMCLGSFSAAILQRGILRLGSDTSLEALGEAMKPGGEAMGWATGAVLCSLTASLAIPIYAKLLWESWRQCGDKKRFFLILTACALASEIPYDLTMSGALSEWSTQNPVWALLLSAIMLEIFAHWHFSNKVTDIAFKALVILAALAWALLLRVYLGAIWILLIALMYFAGKREWLVLLGGTVITILQFPAPLGLMLAHWYDEKKESGSAAVFCILYPAQLLVFGLLHTVFFQ